MEKRRPGSEYNDAELLALTRASYIIRELRETSQTITTPMLDLFFTVALNPGYGPNEYSRRIGTLAPSISNQFAKLGGEKDSRGKPMDLLKEGPPLGDPRAKGYYLSENGKKLIRRILKAQGV
jgi:hypothetical protein